jgi:protein TonB
VRDDVVRVIAERARMDRGFPRSLGISVAGHLILVVAAVAAPLLAPSEPVLNVQMGFVVPLPPGGGGPQAPPPSAPPEAKPAPTAEPAPPPPEKKQILKPPTPVKPEAKGLPDPDTAKNASPRKKATPEPQRAVAGASSSTGTGTATPGLDIMAPAGPGVPGGTDPGGDWYLAGVQRKIWVLWNQQIRSGPQRSVSIQFSILADGSVTDVRVAATSGVYLLDQAAQRAIHTAAPFTPLPEHYATDRFTITATFKPLG